MTNTQEWVNGIVDRSMQKICKDYEANLKTYIEYEFSIINAELTMRTKLHGQDFKTMPHQLVEHIKTSISGSNGNYSLNVTVGQEGTKGVEESVVEMFKDYVIKNAQKRTNMSMY